MEMRSSKDQQGFENGTSNVVATAKSITIRANPSGWSGSSLAPTTVEKLTYFCAEPRVVDRWKSYTQWNYQLRFTSGSTSTSINFYPSGTALIQGNPNEMRSTLEHWWQQQQAEQAPPTLWDRPISASEQSREDTSSLSPASSLVETKVMAHIGTDEAGKGDYFGPLVVAGVYVDEDSAFHSGIRCV